ncbi:hypothetical protein Tco_1282159, partial [Tanacetum coccineum]
LNDVATFLAAAAEEKQKRGHVLSILTKEWSKQLGGNISKKTSSEILPSGDGSRGVSGCRQRANSSKGFSLSANVTPKLFGLTPPPCNLDNLYEKFSISSEETINSSFTWFNVIVTSLKSLDQDYSNKDHVRKFLHALPLKWRAKVMAIEEVKDLVTLPLDKLFKMGH